MSRECRILTAVRVRPLSSAEIAAGAKDVVRCDESLGIGISEIFNTSRVTNERFFKFDYDFYSANEEHPLYSSQSDIFQKIGRPIVDGCLDGINCALFAYGLKCSHTL